MSFLNEVRDSFPSTIALPPEFATLLSWLESEGMVQDYTRSPGRFATIYPQTSPGYQKSCITIQCAESRFINSWLGNDDVSLKERIVIFIRTGGDGSHAGIWLNDQGEAKFVNLGSGSGSTMACVLTDNAMDFLRLLAIGYDELCWPEEFEQTPAEIFEEQNDECGCDEAEAGHYSPPVEFQNWLKRTYGVEIPEKASSIVISTAKMNDKDSSDEFWQWTKKMAR